MNTVAFLVQNHLPYSEPYIYSQMVNQSRYQVVVATKQVLNREIYPCERIWSEEELSGVQRYLSRINYALTGNYPALVEFLQVNQVRLLHAHFGFWGVELTGLARYLNLPLLTSFYGVDISALPRIWTYRRKLKRLWERGAGFLVLSNQMKQVAIDLGAAADKVHVLRIGVDLNRFKSPGQKVFSERVRFLVCSRLVEKKGICYAVEAFARLSQRYPEIELKIVGDGPQKPAILKKITELGLQERVSLIPLMGQHEVIKYLEQSDILLYPSVTADNGDQEGTPVTIMEAMAFGLPVISSYHAAINEVVLDGVSGYLVAERDVMGLAEKMELLINHPQVWAEMGEQGRAYIELNYSAVKQAEQLAEIYDQVLKDQ